MTNDTPQPPPRDPAPAASARPPGSDDLDHLRLLSIFHYVLAALVALMSLLPLFQLAIMGMILADPEVHREPVARVALAGMGAFLVLMILVGLVFAACLVLAGRNLVRGTRYTFCLVMAALSCVLVPVGTALGIFTILVLLRPTVKERFGHAPA